MSDLTLIYEPDSEVHARIYGEGIAQALPARQILATSKRSEALARAPEVTVLIAKAQDVSPELVAAMPRLAWIQALTTGIDPLLALKLPPTVLVTSTRGIHGPQMAELTILLMMALARDLPRMLAHQREKRWERWGQRLLAGKTLVIVGVGAISEALAARCKPLGLKVVGITSRRVVDHFDEIYPRPRLHEAISGADFLVLLVPYSPETHHLIDASAFNAMKPTAYLINVARGGVVDEGALIDALQTRRIAGAGLDVFVHEPLPYSSPLWTLDNVIVTPHVGGMSDIYPEQVLPLLLHNLRAHLAGDHAAMLNRVELKA
jgi:phosphoglycerate dehydrogenase-like enzyme